MTYDPKSAWNKAIQESGMPYPSEYVIRIFKGGYPRLNLDKASFAGKKIVDVGCGEGRNVPLLAKCGFDVSAVEITPEIAECIRKNLADLGLSADVRVGTNDHLPFADAAFDYLLSWNAGYYMGDEDASMDAVVAEFARALKPGGTLVLSIPKKNSFIYDKSTPVKPGYVTVQNDPFGMRNGEIMRRYDSEAEIAHEFESHFTDFVFGAIDDDCFGLEYHWHMVVCKKKVGVGGEKQPASMKTIIDLTYPIHEGMTTFAAPWHALVSVKQLGRHGFEGRETREVTMGTHTGTQIDAPLHFIPGGASIDATPLDHLVGPVTIIDVSDLGENGVLTADRLRRYELGQKVIVRFGWGKHWGTKEFYCDYPFFSLEAARYLVERGVHLVGFDTASPDDGRTTLSGDLLGTPEDSPIHKIFLGAGVSLLEYVANLDRVQDLSGWTLAALPLPIRGADGSPARVCIFR